MVLVCKFFFTPDASVGSGKNDLYPYAPAQVVLKTLAGAAFKNPAGEKVELHTEEERVETLKREFGLLPHVSTSEAVRNIHGKRSAIQPPPTT